MSSRHGNSKHPAREGSARLTTEAELAAENAALRDRLAALGRARADGGPSALESLAAERFRSILRTAMDGFCLLDIRGRFLDANEAYSQATGYSRDELLAMTIADVEAAETPEEMDRHIRDIGRTGSGRFETRHRRKDGGIVDLEVSVNYFSEDGGRFFCFLRDITTRKQADRNLTERTRQLEAIRSVSEEITREMRLPVLLELIVHRAMVLTQAVGGSIFLWDEGRSVLVPGVWVGQPPASRASQISLGDGVAGTVAARRAGLIVNDYRNWLGARHIILEHTPITATIAEPLLYRESLIGVIALDNGDTGRTFSEQDGALLRLFATQAAIAIENARLYEAAQRDLAERKRMEGNLRESEARYRQIVETATEGIWVVDVDNRTILTNRTMAGLLGYTVAEMTGRLLTDFVGEEERGKVATAMERRRQGVAERLERTFLRKDGTPILALVNTSPMHDETGRYVGSFGMVTDITETRRAQRALADRTRQLDALRIVSAEITRELELTALLDLIHRRAAELVDVHCGAIHLWDDETQRLATRSWHGYGPWRGEVSLPLGHGVAGTVAQRRAGMAVNDYRSSPYASPVFLERAETTAVLAEPLLYRDRLLGVIVVTNDGTGRDFSEDDRQLLGLFANQAAIAIENARLYEAAQRDVAERTRAEEALSARTRQLEAVRRITIEITRELNLGALLDLVVSRAVNLIAVRSGTLFLWDDVADALVSKVTIGLGEWFDEVRLRPGEGVAGTVAQQRVGLIVNDYRSSLWAIPRFVERTDVKAVLGEPLLYRNHLVGVILLRDRRDRQPFTVDDQDLLRLFAAQVAIAMENARLFAELKRAYEDVQRAQDELIRSEKLRALGQMAAGMAHDLNNTLAAVLGQTELLRLRVSDPSAQESLNTLSMAATDGVQVVRRLQEFARQQPGQTLTAVDLGTAVREALEITRSRWKDEPQQRGAVIQVEVALSDLPPILGLASEIREALTNLIFNAVDAMPRGGTVTVRGQLVNSPKGQLEERQALPSQSTGRPIGRSTSWVELTVSDTGVGMSEGVRRRIFDPFFTTKGLRGTGLGLSVVYGIMQRHGGHIDVDSAPDKGTTFTLRFQVAGQPAAPPQPSATRRSVTARRLFLVDDDTTVRRTLADLLRSAGHIVTEFDDGVMAVKQLGEHPPDLVLTDLGMPEMSGWEVARACKLATPGLPVILLTGWGERPASESDHPGVADRILGKPVRLNELLEVIEELTPGLPDAKIRS